MPPRTTFGHHTECPEKRDATSMDDSIQRASRPAPQEKSRCFCRSARQRRMAVLRLGRQVVGKICKAPLASARRQGRVPARRSPWRDFGQVEELTVPIAASKNVANEETAEVSCYLNWLGRPTAAYSADAFFCEALLNYCNLCFGTLRRITCPSRFHCRTISPPNRPSIVVFASLVPNPSLKAGVT